MGLISTLIFANEIKKNLKGTSTGAPKTQNTTTIKKNVTYKPPVTKYYCEYCGQKFSSVQTMVINVCPRHPDNPMKGKHKLYEGSEKTRYTCKYCGQTFTSIESLTTNKCFKHPKGSLKGRHSPAL